MNKDLAGVGDRVWRCRAERTAAGIARNAEIRPRGGSEINTLIDNEGERHRGAGAANRRGGEDDIAAEFARDAVAGVSKREVAEAVDGDAAGTAKWSA